VNPGWFDFILISPSALPHFLETKRLGEDIEEGSDQGDFRDWCDRTGIPHAVCWTMGDVLIEFARWRCTRLDIPERHDLGAQIATLGADSLLPGWRR
jgi:hypothetical protein